jgi:putative ABC transport system permease protein
MFFRIVSESFARSPRRKFITGAALAMGMAVATATLTVALDVGDRLAAEFRSLGANLLVAPKADTLPLEVGGVDYRPVDAGAYLPVDDLPKLKQIFWRNNIKGFTPFLDVPVLAGPGEQKMDLQRVVSTTLIGTWVNHKVDVGNGEVFDTGVELTHPWWRLENGRWFGENAEECVVGATLAKRDHLQVGDLLHFAVDGSGATGMEARPSGATAGIIGVVVPANGPSARVTGIVSTGGREDNAVLAPLFLADHLAGQGNVFRRLTVSALVKPDDAFGRRDPGTLSPAEYDRWYCSAYIGSIALQIEQVIPGAEARPIRQVAEGEGRILNRVSGLLWTITLAALIAAGLAVGATAATSVLERQKEVGLMKALGAGNSLVGAFFLGEQILLAIFAGGAGYAGGILLARWLSESVFGVTASPRLILLPISLALSILVAVIGSAFPLRRASRFSPAPILRGE